MIQQAPYRNLRGKEISFDGLDADELDLIEELRRRAEEKPDWNDFDNFWMKQVGDFYLDRGLSRRAVTKTAAWKLAQDLSGRIAIKNGHARAPDYRDELDELIRENFPTRRAFCEATGLSEDLLCHVLARRKHLGIGTLNDALSKIGFTLRIAPMASANSD